MPKKCALTLRISKKPFPQCASQQAPSLSLSKLTSLSLQPQNTQLKSQLNKTLFSLSLSNLLNVKNTSDPSKAIDYLIDYQFVYEKDILLQNFRVVKLWGFKHFQYWKTMMKKQELAKEYDDIHKWQINKMHSRAKIRHKTMKLKKNSITVNLAKSNSWFNIKTIMIQWVDKEKVQKGIRVSIDVLYTWTKHEAPLSYNDDDIKKVTLSVRKKQVCLWFYTIDIALIVSKN